MYFNGWFFLLHSEPFDGWFFQMDPCFVARIHHCAKQTDAFKLIFLLRELKRNTLCQQ